MARVQTQVLVAIFRAIKGGLHDSNSPLDSKRAEVEREHMSDARYPIFKN